MNLNETADKFRRVIENQQGDRLSRTDRRMFRQLFKYFAESGDGMYNNPVVAADKAYTKLRNILATESEGRLARRGLRYNAKIIRRTMEGNIVRIGGGVNPDFLWKINILGATRRLHRLSPEEQPIISFVREEPKHK